MIKVRFSLRGVKATRSGVALLVAATVAATLLWSATISWAQTTRTPGRERTPTNRGGATGGGAPAADQLPPEPADAEEGPPEEQFDKLPVDAALRKLDPKVRASLRDGNFADPQAQSDFDSFYTGYFLSRWTDQENIRQLHKYRQELANHLRSAVPGAPRKALLDTALEFLKRLIVGHYHPAVKINAMLAIGELNRVEAIGRDPAVPLPEALPVLLTGVESNKLSEGLHLAAMVGVLRHLAAGISNSDAQEKVYQLLRRQVAADLPASPRFSPRAWMVAKAAEGLGSLGIVGDNNQVFTALMKLVANDKLPFPVRCAAADALSHLDYSSANGIQPVDAAAALAQLAVDACKDGLATDKHTTRIPFRRRILGRIIPVQLALSGDDSKNHGGIASLAKEPPQKDFVAALQKALKEAIDELDYKDPKADFQKDPDVVELKDMKATVTKLQNDLEQLLKKKP